MTPLEPARRGEPVCETLLIAGAGLIGASIAQAARMRGLAARVFVFDPDPEVVDAARALKLADEAASDPAAFTARADLAALCAPPGAIADAYRALADHIAADAVVFDVGSMKAAVAAALAVAARPGHGIVPAHPIAGSERSGPAAGRADLFHERWCVMTPTPALAAPEAAVAKVEAFWRGLGARVRRMEPADHDALLAATSHVPHLIAYALTATALDADGAPDADMVRFSAGGFRDFTRIAASDPTMWRDVFLGNRDGALAALDRFAARLETLRALVAAGDGPGLSAAFAEARAVRAAIIAAGQETAKPDFGRAEPADDQ